MIPVKHLNIYIKLNCKSRHVIQVAPQLPRIHTVFIIVFSEAAFPTQCTEMLW